MYPLLIITNLSSFFFILISLIMVPQIYTNAMQGQRPNISSAYYSKFLTYRFLLIVIFFSTKLYLKCFPWNIFNLEPNYLLSFSCIALLAFQVFLFLCRCCYYGYKDNMDPRKSYLDFYYLLFSIMVVIKFKWIHRKALKL